MTSFLFSDVRKPDGSEGRNNGRGNQQFGENRGHAYAGAAALAMLCLPRGSKPRGGPGGWLHRSDAVRSHHAAISVAYMRIPFAPSM